MRILYIALGMCVLLSGTALAGDGLVVLNNETLNRIRPGAAWEERLLIFNHDGELTDGSRNELDFAVEAIKDFSLDDYFMLTLHSPERSMSDSTRRQLEEDAATIVTYLERVHGITTDQMVVAALDDEYTRSFNSENHKISPDEHGIIVTFDEVQGAPAWRDWYTSKVIEFHRKGEAVEWDPDKIGSGIEVTVIDIEDSPVDATVTVNTNDGRHSVFHVIDGNPLQIDLVPGTYAVWVTASHYRSLQYRLPVEMSNYTPLTSRLEPDVVAVAVRLTDTNGEPLDGEILLIKGAYYTGIDRQRRIKDGFGEIRLPSPKPVVEVYAKGYETQQFRLPLDPGMTSFLFEPRLERETGRVAVKVTDPQGKLLKAVMRIEEPEYEGREFVINEGEGVFKLLPGIYTITISASDHQDFSARRRVMPPGEATEWDIELRPDTGQVRLKVTDLHERPLEATILITGDGEPDKIKIPKGEEPVIRLNPGKYSAQVESDGYEPRTVTFRVSDEPELLTLTLSESFNHPGDDAEAFAGSTGTLQFAFSRPPVHAHIKETGKDIVLSEDASSTELDPGIYTVWFTKPGYQGVSRRFRIVSGKTTLVPVQLKMAPSAFEPMDDEDRAHVIPEFPAHLMPYKAVPGIRFRTGKADIKIESYPKLDAIAREMESYPDFDLVIMSHTDSVGDASVNKRLSGSRAKAVVDYLARKGDVDSDRMHAFGLGETMPIAPNETEEGRTINRRIEFYLVPHSARWVFTQLEEEME